MTSDSCWMMAISGEASSSEAASRKQSCGWTRTARSASAVPFLTQTRVQAHLRDSSIRVDNKNVLSAASTKGKNEVRPRSRLDSAPSPRLNSHPNVSRSPSDSSRLLERSLKSLVVDLSLVVVGPDPVLGLVLLWNRSNLVHDLLDSE